MSLIGLEISDAGIIAAADTSTGLLELDGQTTRSPGFALLQKKGMLLGKEAESKAQLFPRQILNHFWDQLDTEPLKLSGKHAPQNHAEIVFQHLSHIWQAIQKHGDQIAMVVPEFYNHRQLGLILGIAQELSMDVKGFVPMALAASSKAIPGKMLLYLDVHLHRIQVIHLKQGEYLTIEDSVSTPGKGLLELYRIWIETIAQEFVRSTRFDPIHLAATEQELYDRLPGVLAHFQQHSAIVFDMINSGTSYSITLKDHLLARRAESIYVEICRSVEKIRTKHGKETLPVALQLSHRLSRLPGCKEMLSTLKNIHIIELDRGAGARGILGIWQQLSDQTTNEEISFFTSRPWQHSPDQYHPEPSPANIAGTVPTHLLYRSIAYPITENPLSIVRETGSGKTRVHTLGRSHQFSSRYCTIERRGGNVVLYDDSTGGISINQTRVEGSVSLELGHIIQLEATGDQLQLIACLDPNET